MPRLEYWYHASMRCALCGYNWIAEGPVGAVVCDCPQCESSVLLPEKLLVDMMEVRANERTNVTRPVQV